MALSSPRPKNRYSDLLRQSPFGPRLLIGWLALATCCATVSFGQTPLYEQRPFDRITLDAANDNLVLDVLPLDSVFPDRKLPEKFPTTGKLIVEPINEPGSQYECYWRSVAKIVLFEQLILDEVNGLVRAGRFEDAYQYFAQLENERPDLPGLQEALENYLYEEAKAFHRSGKYDAALARLREIYDQNPQRPGLDRALGAATEQLVDKAFKAEQYWIARDYLGSLAKQFPQSPVVSNWHTRLQELAAQRLAGAKAAFAGNSYREANALLRQMSAIWPDLPGAEELRRDIAVRYPRCVVGVESPAAARQQGRLHDWASRRSGRLVERTLLEFAGPGTEGGQYVCPVGEMKAKDLGRQLEFKLRPDISVGDGDTVLTGYDLSRQVLAMADPSSPQYLQLWYDLFESVSVHDVFTADVRLRRPFVLPQAMLQTPITTQPGTFGGVKTGATIGPYVVESLKEKVTVPPTTPVESLKDEQTIYLTNTSYFAGATSRPKEIVEQRFVAGDELIRALRRGDVDVVDRINLWELDKFRALRDVEVKRYAVPLVHCLIPNPKRPLSSRRAYRRALVYGIDREAILRLLVRGEKVPGCQVISGPFSAGVTIDDPLDYAYDNSIEPRSYEPYLAVALAEVAWKEYLRTLVKEEEPDTAATAATTPAPETPADGAAPGGEPAAVDAAPDEAEAAKAEAEAAKAKAVPKPKTVLAHPATETARMAVRQIQRHLKIVGIQIELKELGPELPNQIPEDVDLLYAELAMWEPIVDADRLLGEEGMMGEASPYMRQALLKLRQSGDWPTVGERLRDIHRLAHSEVTIIPLWQLSDYFAHVRDLDGLGDAPVTLYQYVEEWRTNLQATSRKK